MARFTTGKRHSSVKTLLIVFLFLGFLWLCSEGTDTFSKQSLQVQQTTLKQALYDSTIEYYALNGYYPESLDALLQYIPISYDSSKFFIDYQPSAANILPDITVIVRK